ncbi:alpha/beta hydrolase [Arsenicicoccus bolidensis]|uniref:Alpha/beta hydrolase n=1 Tax=Arsenicicoccus bolidensis TaxID=229480 RepID=A0ABS9Q1E9_9MICO|nr:alpha/beta hydrolase [Arsenicicoccus bolidensis]MCG7320923.1 alpha/beta hydrolase [Arsenicicoccus bolidensis]
MTSLRRSRTARSATSIAAASMLLGACAIPGTGGTSATTSPSSASPSGSSATGSSGSSATSTATASHAPDLAKYYGQQLTWELCGRFECSWLTVPVDYDKPDGATLRLALKRQKSSSSSRTGSLVLNPGGPGASGVDMVDWFAPTLAGNVQRRFDVVGFDPRGVAKSQPVTCLDPRQMDDLLGGDPTPDTPAEQGQLMAANKAFGEACKQRTGDLLAHVSTVEAAKDMDVLRATLGDQRLNYFGASYGTFLGATYAGLFPQHVGQMVLDGVIDPAQDGKQSALGQATGFERATRAYAQHCVDTGSCPVGGSVDEVMKGLADLLKQIDAKPLPAPGVGTGTLTEGWASMGLALPMYSDQLWPELDGALRAAKGGDGSGLMRLATQYADRQADGSYNGNMLQAINAVNCLDRPVPGDAARYAADEKDFLAVAPTWGRFMAWGDAVCGVWPVPATGKAAPISATGSGPILVLGTTRDPATPYENSVALAKQLDQGVLVTRDGDGHTAYQQGNNCVDRLVDDYLVKGKVPADGAKC